MSSSTNKTTRKKVRIISATSSDTVQVQAVHAEELEKAVNHFIEAMPAESILDIKLLSVGIRDAWAMIIYEEEIPDTK